MNYELCRKLKEAGFPQTGLKYTWYYSTKPMGIFNSGEEYLDVKNHPDRIVCPTLSELIEACGDKFEQVRRCPGVDTHIWWAYETWKKEGVACGEGDTPEEAVANLWLELNSKK